MTPGYARDYPDGTRVPDPKSAPLLGHDHPLDDDERFELLRIIPAAWNKAYRGEYVTTHGFRFAEGLYEDVPWTYPILMEAKSIVTTDQVCYLYRQRRSAGILASTGQAHFDLISQYDRVFDHIDARERLEAWRWPILAHMVWHIGWILERTDRIPPADRGRFFRAAGASIRRHRLVGHRPPGRLRAKVWLVGHGSYRVFHAAQLARRGLLRIVGGGRQVAR